MKKLKRPTIFKLATFCIMFLLVATTSNALLFKDYSIIVETDKEEYYQGETVYVTGQLLNDGQGTSGGYCPKVLDPEHISYWDPGTCYGSEPDGTFTFEFDISLGAMLGTYTICVHGYIETWEGWENITIEVIEPEEVIAEANGPYEGIVGEPIDFFGDATGGVPPYEWHWDFGDGEISDEQNPTYTYNESGEFIATLTVTDSMDGEGIDTADVTISPIPNDPPNDPEIEGETNGDYGETYTYTIMTEDPEEHDVKYVIEWGDEETTETEYYASGEEIEVTHSWDEEGTYTVRVKAIDEELAESGWTELEVSMPASQNMIQGFLTRLFERFPSAFLIFRSLLGI